MKAGPADFFCAPGEKAGEIDAAMLNSRDAILDAAEVKKWRGNSPSLVWRLQSNAFNVQLYV